MINDTLDIGDFSATKRELLELLIQEKGLDIPNSKIPHRPDIKKAPLSFSQLAVWSAGAKAQIPAPNLSIGLRLTGLLNIGALEQSLQQIIQRHEIFSASFVEENDSLYQLINSNVDFQLSVLEASKLQINETNLPEFLTQEAQGPFDLENPPLFRASLLQLGEQNHILILTAHQLIFDQWSWGIMLREIGIFYNNFSQNNPNETPQQTLPEILVQYPHFAQWHRQRFQGEMLQQQLDYWQQHLSNHTPTQWPIIQPKAAAPTHHICQQSLTLPYTLTRTLQALAKAEGVTLFMTLLAALQILLHSYTGSEDILISSPFANRNQPETTSLIGCFANTLLLRTFLSGNPTFQQLLQQIRQIVAQAYSHQELPYQRVVDSLKTGHKLQPLLYFSFQNKPQIEPLSLPGLTVSFLPVYPELKDFNLSLLVVAQEEKIHLTFTHRDDILYPQAAAKIIADYQTLLESIATNPEQQITSLSQLLEIQPKSEPNTDSEAHPHRRQSDAKDQLEMQLKQIWEEVLALRSISLQENFFELGGHSLLAVRLFAKIREKFNKDLPLATLLQAPTIQLLAEILRQEEKVSFSSLVPIQTSGTKPPLFCIHALGGNVLSYQPIAYYLGPDQPVYGLQARGVDGKQEPHNNLEQMAADYLKEIRQVQPQGPYYLVGHSLGGVIVFEIAQQLQKAGEKVELLGLFDTFSPSTFGQEKPPFKYQMYIHKMNLSRLDTKDKVIYILERVWWKIENLFKKIRDKIYIRVGLPLPDELPEHLENIEKVNSQSVRNYKPQPYPGKITLFRGLERPTIKYYEPLLGWGEFAQQGVEVIEVPGHHKTMILEPCVRILSQKLKAYLEKLQNG